MSKRLWKVEEDMLSGALGQGFKQSDLFGYEVVGVPVGRAQSTMKMFTGTSQL
jgi:hypothetical protein